MMMQDQCYLGVDNDAPAPAPPAPTMEARRFLGFEALKFGALNPKP